MFTSKNSKKDRLLEAASSGNLQKVKTLLDRGADADSCSYSGMTPMHWASHYGHLEVVRLLLDRGANVHATANDKQTPLYKASWNGHLEVVRLLLDRGANVHATDNNKEKPLHNASWKGHLEVVRLLLDRGANVHATANDKKTPLHKASLDGHLEVVLLLLDRGANVDAADKYKHTPLHWASWYGRLKMVRLLLDRGADKNLRDIDGNTPLDLARDHEHHKIAELLEGADELLRDPLGNTPLDGAKDRNHRKIAESPEQYKPKMTTFFELLFESNKLIHDAVSAYEIHQKLGKALSNLPELKVYYTLLKIHVGQGVISKERVKPILSKALSKMASRCSSEDALVMFKLIQNKCHQDGMLEDEDFIRFDNRAEVKRMEHADFVIDMKTAISSLEDQMEAVKKNIEILDTNLHEVNENLDKLKDAMKFKMKVEAGVSAISMCLSAVTFGIGGGVAQFFGQVANGIVDFGDTVHIAKVIDSTAVKENCNPQDGLEMNKDLTNGIDMALEGASSLIINQRMEAALREGRPMVAIGFAATVMSPGGPKHTSPDDVSGPQKAIDNFKVWPDAVFDDDAEDQGLDLHFAVKYSEEEELKQILSGGLEVEVINQTDSKGRTALDLAALTGQKDLMVLLEDKGAKHSQNRVRLRVIAKKRSENVESYKQCIANTVE